MPVSDLGQLSERFGRYRLVEKLGEGGMGVVYRAEDTKLRRQVALKVPHSRQASFVARFQQEARSAARLNHPNICSVHDVGDVNGVPYITMSLIDGRPLDKHCDGRQLPPVEAATIVLKLALAVHEAHKQGIIHRDLKPANVMLNRRGEPIVMDFGLARQTNHDRTRLTQTGGVLGTPAYMSPEQHAGDQNRIGPATDIYSLGVILYELLTGTVPFAGPLPAVMAQVERWALDPPSRHCRGLDPALEAICLKAMAKSASDRFSSMNDLATSLQRWLHSQSLARGQPPGAQLAEASDTVRRPGPPPVGGRVVGAPARPPRLGSRSGIANPGPGSRFGSGKRRLLLAVGGGAGTVAVCAVFLIAIFGRSDPAPIGGKPLPPDAARVERAKQSLRKEHEATLASKQPEEKRRLVEWLRTGAKTASELLDKNARFDLAREIAVSIGDFDLAFEVCQEIAGAFYVDLNDLKAQTLDDGRIVVSEFADVLAVKALREGFAALALKRINTKAAKSIANTAEFSANRSGREEWKYQARLLKDDTERITRAYPQFELSIKHLELNPTDQPARTEVGKFWCLTENDWSHGLPLLKEGDNTAFKFLAESESSVEPTAPALVALGNKWWESAERDGKDLAELFRERARHWYLKAIAAPDKDAKDESLKLAARRAATAHQAHVVLRIQLTDLAGICEIQFLDDGFNVKIRSSSTPALTINHLPAISDTGGHYNCGSERLLPNATDFSKAKIAINSGRSEAIQHYWDSEEIQLQFDSEKNGSGDFDVTVSIEPSGRAFP